MDKEKLAELEGKKITWSNGERFKFKAIVAGFDYDIGLSIVDEDDKDHNLTCLHGPSYKVGKSNYNRAIYDKEIEKAFEMIQEGYFKVKKMPKVIFHGTGLICPFE